MRKLFMFCCCCLLAMALTPIARAQESCLLQPTDAQLKHLTETRVARQQFDAHNHGGAESSGGIKWVPIQFHNCVLNLNNNPDGFNYTGYVDNAMSRLNQLFAPYQIQFYECGMANKFVNGTLYGFDATEEPQLTAYDVPNVLNVYFFGAVTSGGTNYCGYSYLPPSADRIIMSKSCIGIGSEEIFVHEVGHYFGLYHTHGKGNTLTDELVNGSNCATAGDDVCDTPADPQLNTANTNPNTCVYAGTQRDANNQLYQPNPANYMSYSWPTCRNMFTPQQMNRMAYAVHNDRNYLTGCAHPNNCTTPIATLPHGFDFETGWEGWSNAWIEPDWFVPAVLNSGPTPTANTGPDQAFSGNNYLYVEGSGNLNAYERYGILRSPCFDLRGYSAPKMSFRYHLYGADIYGMYVQASTDGGYDWSTLPQQLLYINENVVSLNQWRSLEVDLSAFNNVPNVQLRIGVALWYGEEGDFAIDSVSVYNTGSVAPCSLAIAPVVQHVNCFGQNNGEIGLQITGENGALTFNWSNGATTASIDALAPGVYSVTTTDAQGCTATASATVLQPALLTVTIAATPANSGSNGTATATAAGGTAPYYYFWSNSATTASIGGLAAGTYTVTVIDSNDCPATATATVLPPVSNCASTLSVFPATATFEQNFLVFERIMGYSTNWVRRNSPTPNANTGPNAAHQGNYYAFLNSGPTARTGVLRTKDCLNLLGVTNPVLEFYYHMQGANMGTLYVEVSMDNGATWTTAWSLSGNQGNQWTKASVNLQPYNNGATLVQFRGVTGPNSLSDIALDAIYLGPAGNNQFAPMYPEETPAEMAHAQLYPNPTTGVFTFQTSAENPQNLVEVYHQTGRLIWRSDVKGHAYQIDLSAQPPGVYYLRSQNETGVISKKVFKSE